MPAMIPDEPGALAAGAIADITKRMSKNISVIDYATSITPDNWPILAEGNWDMLGVPEDAGGAGLGLRDLVEVAVTWGEQALPLPLLPTIFARRWSEAARTAPGPVTYALEEIDGPTAPFAAFPGIHLISTTGRGALVPLAGNVVSDDFAPTLGKGTAPVATEIDGPPRHELAVLLAAEATGCARRLLADATGYAKAREQFGQPIGRFQAVKHHLANAHISVELAITAVSWAAQDPADYAPPVRIAFQETQRAAELCTQVYGGIGFTWEMGVHVFLRHIISLRAAADSLLTHSATVSK